jgi:hypothetical protein
MHCPICPPAVSGDARTIWKYNAAYHVLSEHSDADLIATAPKFIVEMFIRKEEELKMGIDERQTVLWRDLHRIPDSDAIDVLILEAEKDSEKEQQKRARGNTASTVRSDAQPQPKKLKNTV